MTGFSPQHSVFSPFLHLCHGVRRYFSPAWRHAVADGYCRGTAGHVPVIGAALGVQLSLLVAGRVLRAVGFRWIMLVGIVIISGFEMIASLSLGPLAFFCWLFVAGLAIGVVEVAVNVEADRTEFPDWSPRDEQVSRFLELWVFWRGFAGGFDCPAADFRVRPHVWFSDFHLMFSIAADRTASTGITAAGRGQPERDL